MPYLFYFWWFPLVGLWYTCIQLALLLLREEIKGSDKDEREGELVLNGGEIVIFYNHHRLISHDAD